MTSLLFNVVVVLISIPVIVLDLFFQMHQWKYDVNGGFTIVVGADVGVDVGADVGVD